jgi:hypothetical protein
MLANGLIAAVHDSPSSPNLTGLARHHSPWTMDRARKKNKPHQDRHEETDLPVCISEDEGAHLTVSYFFSDQFLDQFLFSGECDVGECSVLDETILEMRLCSMGSRLPPTDKKTVKTRFSTSIFLPSTFTAGMIRAFGGRGHESA